MHQKLDLQEYQRDKRSHRHLQNTMLLYRSIDLAGYLVQSY